MPKAVKIAIYYFAVFVATFLMCEWYARNHFRGGMTIARLDNKLDRQVEYFGFSESDSMYSWANNIFRPNQGSYLIDKHILTGTNSLVTFDINGLRIDDQPYAQSVLVIGDSNTIQDYLNFSETWAGKLQNITNNKIKVFNAAVPSYGIRSQIARLKEVIPTIKPKVIILGWYLNDLTSCCISRKFLPRLPFFNSVFIEELDRRIFWRMHGFYRTDGDIDNSELDKLKVEIQNEESFARLNKNAQQLILDNFYDWGNAFSNKAITQIDLSLIELQQIANSANAQLIVVMLPHRDQLRGGILDDSPQQIMSQLLARKNIDFINLIWVLNATKNPSQLFFDHCHLKQSASLPIASEIVKFIR